MYTNNYSYKYFFVVVVLTHKNMQEHFTVLLELPSILALVIMQTPLLSLNQDPYQTKPAVWSYHPAIFA